MSTANEHITQFTLRYRQNFSNKNIITGTWQYHNNHSNTTLKHYYLLYFIMFQSFYSQHGHVFIFAQSRHVHNTLLLCLWVWYKYCFVLCFLWAAFCTAQNKLTQQKSHTKNRRHAGTSKSNTWCVTGCRNFLIFL